VALSLKGCFKTEDRTFADRYDNSKEAIHQAATQYDATRTQFIDPLGRPNVGGGWRQPKFIREYHKKQLQATK